MKKNISLILLIVWMIVIFLFSNAKGTESQNTSDSVIDIGIKIIEKISGKSISQLKKIEIKNNLSFVVRKLAHITEYLILGILMYNYLNCFKVNYRLLISILLCILYASFDEFHQLFIDGRSGNIIDVLIDSIGIIIGNIICRNLNNNK